MPKLGDKKGSARDWSRRIDAFVEKLVKDAEKTPVEVRISLFNALSKWVAVKNRLTDAMEGEQLYEFRKRLHAPGKGAGASRYTFTDADNIRGGIARAK